MAGNPGFAVGGSLCVLLVLCVLPQSSHGPGEAPRDPDSCVVDRRMTGTWLLLEQSNIVPSERVPAEISAVHIHADGSVEGVGVDAASGTLRLGGALNTSLRGRATDTRPYPRQRRYAAAQ
ncbi:MAG: hypothetical protein IH600_02385 [Bacteroidetes bacterium]|nr:hypothetical protein [Bacteroidota bacterium]